MFNEYFSAKSILSKGALFNYILSDRSDGKTFDIKVRALENFINKRKTTIYLRRYKTEFTDELKQCFFDEVLNVPKYTLLYGDYKFRYNKMKIEIYIDNKWQTIVYFIPLTMSAKLKSTLVVKDICEIDFDEYIPLDNRYIKNEMMLLLEFWKSVDRDRDNTRLIICGNKVTPFSPFFDYFNIPLSITSDKIRTYKNGTIAVQIYSSEEHRDYRKQSRFNDLIKDTSYSDYDNGGILQAINVKIKQRNNALFFMSFKSELGEGSIWFKNECFYISQYKRKDGPILCDKYYNIERDIILIEYGNFIKILKKAYLLGLFYFEDEKSFYIFEPLIRKFYK